MSSLRTCFKSLKEINDLLFKFLWDGKKDKIKRSEMIADYGDGGQKLLDIMVFNKSLKIAWIVKYISDDCKSKWKTFWDLYLSKWGGKLVFLENLRKQDVKKCDIKMTAFENLSNFGWTLISETLSSPNMTFVAV